MNKARRDEVKMYAVQLKAEDIRRGGSKEMFEQTGYVGIYPDYPHAYVMYRTREEQRNAWEYFHKHFAYCKIVANPVFVEKKYIPREVIQ